MCASACYSNVKITHRIKGTTPTHKAPFEALQPQSTKGGGNSPLLVNLILCVQYQSLQTTSYSHHNLKTHFLHRIHPRKQKSTLGPGVSKNTLYIDLCVPASNRAGKTDLQSLERDQRALAHLQHCWVSPSISRAEPSRVLKNPQVNARGQR